MYMYCLLKFSPPQKNINIPYSTLLISIVGSLETFVVKQDVFENGAYEVSGLGSQRCFIKSGLTLSNMMMFG